MRPTIPSAAASFLLLGALAFGAISCGGASKSTSGSVTSAGTQSTSSSTGSGASSHPSSFVAGADAICKRTNTAILAIHASSASAAEVKRVVPRTASLELEAIQSLQSLSPPPSVARSWRQMLQARRLLAHQLSELLDAARKNDGTSLKPLLAAKKRAHAILTEAATAAGFKDCAKVGSVG